MGTRRVVVEGGGENLYEISESSGYFWARKIKVNLIFNDKKELGRARSLEDALALIKSHSGRQIKSID